MNILESTKQILKNLVAYPVLPEQSNLQMIDYIATYLESFGVESERVYSDDKTRANLFATIGPVNSGGILLSGHTDVVSVEGQKWSHDPFDLLEKNDRLYGRGSVDMKGFLACCLASVPVWQQQTLNQPIQLGFTFDEESGGYGADCLARWMQTIDYKPACAIIGEPTQMQIIAGHKGGNEVFTQISGIEAHSCNPENGVSAIHYAVKMIDFIINKGDELKQNQSVESGFVPPYTSFNIGKISGGSSTNTVAGHCEFQWELRPVPGDNQEQIMAEIDDYCQQVLVPQMRKDFPNANIETTVKASVPGLAINEHSKAMALIKTLTDEVDYDVVAFGTDAGYFQNIGIDSVVFGPGNIIQAHKPDEFIEISQLEKYLNFMSKLPTASL